MAEFESNLQLTFYISIFPLIPPSLRANFGVDLSSVATPMIAFKRSKNLQEIIGGHTVRQGKVFKKKFLRKRLNNHKKDVNNPKSIPASNHFKIHGDNFMKHAKSLS